VIRRDYFIKLVQELSAVLLRVVSLKARREYAAALHEIDCALERYLGVPPGDAIPEKLDHLLKLCSREEGPASDSLNLLGNLFYEQGEVCAFQQNPEASQRAQFLALGLYLESVRSGVISLDILQRIDELVQRLSDVPMPIPVLRRLFRYLEDRGLYATAEDALYEWLDRGDADAVKEGMAFYERLLTKPDEDLVRGNLPRDEVQEGRGKLSSKAVNPPA
jgi:uncharacterized protein DUF6483